MKSIRDFPGGEHCRHWEAIADRFAHRDNIRDHTLRLKRPKVCPHATKADLNLVCDAHPSRRANNGIHGLEVPGGQDHLASTAGDALRNEGGQFPALERNRLHALLNRVGISGAHVRITVLKGAPEPVRKQGDLGVRGPPLPSFPVELVRAEINARDGVAMVGMIKYHHISSLCEGVRQPQGEVVGL